MRWIQNMPVSENILVVKILKQRFELVMRKDVFVYRFHDLTVWTEALEDIDGSHDSANIRGCMLITAVKMKHNLEANR